MPSFSAPPRPCFALRVGVTGHRPGLRLPAGDIDRVTAEVASILGRLAAAARQAQKRDADVFGLGKPGLRLVSALAEGADRIAASAALETGWTLEVVLPFVREEYEKDFKSPDSKKAFRSLLGQASSTFCLAMPRARAARPRAYEAAGHLTLDNCDILLTVWDGKPGQGRGGTPEIIAEALERGVPVLHVHAADKAPPSLLRGERKPEELRPDLAGLVGSLVAPPRDRSGLDCFLREGGPDGAVRDGRILGWWRFTGRFTRFARAFGGDHPRDEARLAEVGSDRNRAASGEAMLHDRYRTADAISTHLGNVYRSAFTLVFLASAFAVLAGLAGVFWWHDAATKALFVCLELCFIGVVLQLTTVGRRREWHRRWLETRRLAELLRVAAALAPAGGGPPIAPESGMGADGAWTQWYVRSILREVRLPKATADAGHLCRMADGFVDDLIDGQIDYHLGNTERLRELHHGLDWIGMKLFWTTFAIGLGFVSLVAIVKAARCFGLDIEHSRYHEVFASLHHIFDEWVKPVVMLCSAGFPALGAALYGIRAQGDYDASASRSEATERALVDVRGRILLARDNPDFVMLRGLFAEAAEIMQSDLSDWRKIYRHRPIAIPA